MKFFISYRFTGEDPKELETTLSAIKTTLENAGHSVYCSFWSERMFKDGSFTNGQIIDHAFGEIKKADAVFALVKSTEKSEGMLLEIGYALAKNKRFFLAIKKGVNTVFIKEKAEKLFDFENIGDLLKQLSSGIV
jgi:nucleoside 2-deoxyribosyltransferase